MQYRISFKFKLNIVIVSVLLSGLPCFSQIQAPTQVDTLYVTSMQYHFDEIRPENWPFTYVLRTPGTFVFNGESFPIVESNDYYDYIKFTLRTSEGIRALLEYPVKETGCRIEFSGYTLLCTKAIVKTTESEGQECGDVPNKLVEEKPSFQGGDANNFSKWVNQHLVYPKEAKDKGLQGRVMLQFTIRTDGTLDNVKVLRGICPCLDAEAVRVVSKSPKWTPGETGGKKVEVTYTFPVIFQQR